MSRVGRIVLLLAVAGCAPSPGALPAATPAAAYDWHLPGDLPPPQVPADNPMSLAKVDLGRRLFYDRRLSRNGLQSCASCHEQRLAFTDGKARAVGSTGEAHARSSMSLVNVAYASTLTWANPNLSRLENQALVPLFGETPVELGFSGQETELLQRLQADADYSRRFAASFTGDQPAVSLATLTKALAAFQRSIVSFDAPFDRYERGEATAVPEAAVRGRALFFSERLECFHCHGGFAYSASTIHSRLPFVESAFFNTGLYNIGGTGAYPAGGQGLYEFSRQSSDMGAFKPPSLRNVALTAPYMHDGSVPTLAEAIDHYAAGGRDVAAGPAAGNGAANPHKSGFVKGFALTPAEKADLLAFLESLTDAAVTTNPAWSDPFANRDPGTGGR